MKKILNTIKKYILEVINLAQTFFQMIRGIWHIVLLPHKLVSILGGARLKQSSLYMKKAHKLAHMLAAENFTILTGGGPGIMEAANCGAIDDTMSAEITLGISVKGLNAKDGKSFNCCASQHLILNYFFARKRLLMNYSVGFIFFPGGFGTLDELSEMLTLIQTNNHARVPIILIGTAYWKPLIQWSKAALQHKLISKDDFTLFTCTDDIQEALSLMVHHTKKSK